jgi:hypothetical protein
LPLINSKLKSFIFSKNPIYNLLFENSINSHHHHYFYYIEDGFNDADDYNNFLNENINSIDLLRNKGLLLHNVKTLFYSLKYKKNLRHFLWERVRRPKIEAKYHPSNLQKMMDELNENDDFTELLENW